MDTTVTLSKRSMFFEGVSKTSGNDVVKIRLATLVYYVSGVVPPRRLKVDVFTKAGSVSLLPCTPRFVTPVKNRQFRRFVVFSSRTFHTLRIKNDFVSKLRSGAYWRFHGGLILYADHGWEIATRARSRNRSRSSASVAGRNEFPPRRVAQHRKGAFYAYLHTIFHRRGGFHFRNQKNSERVTKTSVG